MLRLDVRPFWREILPGVRVQFRNPTPADRAAAHRAVARARAAAEARAVETGVALDEAALADELGIVFTLALAKPCIVAWTGVVDHDDKPIEPTPEAIDAFLSTWEVFKAVDREFVFPELERGREKNGSGRSSDGISAAPTPAKATARTARAGATNVRTASTNRKPTTVKRPGK